MHPARSTISHYTIIGQIGSGGMGIVYEARDRLLDRSVAIKVLPADHSADPGRRARFALEAKAISALNHPNVVTLHEIGVEDGADFIVMELVAGQTLSRIIESGPLEIRTAVSYAHQIADALRATHEQNIIHRDLKPGNVMVSGAGRVKVLDFGLAKWDRPSSPDDETTTALTQTGLVVGTIDYMSPEQGRGELLDARSDIFSFGCILYEMLTGVRPFRGSTGIAVMHATQFTESEPVRSLRPDVSEELAEVVHHCLAKSKETRSTISEVAEMLGDMLQEWSPRNARCAPAKANPPATAAARRLRRPLVLLTGGAAIAASIGTVFVFRPSVLTTVMTQSATPYKLYQEGLEHLERYDRRGNIQKAIDAFRSATIRDERYAPGYAGLALALFYQYQTEKERSWLDQAWTHARKAVDLDPNLADAQVSLALVHAALGRPDEARAAARQALALNPASAAGWRALATIENGERNWQAAEQHAIKATLVEPRGWRNWVELGAIYDNLTRYSDAARAFKQAADLEPDSVVARRNLAGIYHKQGDFAKAAAEFQECLKIQESASSYSSLGTVYFFQGMYPEAATAFEKAVKLGTNNYLHWANLGDAYRLAPGRQADAEAAFTRAIQLLQERLSAKPNDVVMLTRLSVYLAKIGRREEARRLLEPLDRLPNPDANALFRTGLAWELSGERTRAIKSLTHALSAGYAPVEILGDRDLAALRKDPRFQLVLAKQGLRSPNQQDPTRSPPK